MTRQEAEAKNAEVKIQILKDDLNKNWKKMN